MTAAREERSLQEVVQRLLAAVKPLAFSPPVRYVYNPLEYAAAPLAAYLNRFGTGHKEVLLLGMNPGPFGMAQTGIPFGDVSMVRDWLGIAGATGTPPQMHAKRPVLGFACPRSEVSGARLWGWARERYGTPQRFFQRFFVWNYCPLCFMSESGTNVTPDRLPARETAPLFSACDHALRGVCRVLDVQIAAGVGAFAEARCRAALGGLPIRIGRIPHPSPASPMANRGWAAQADAALSALGAL